MMGKKIQNKCKSIRGRLQRAIAARVNLDTGWLAEHIAACPRCQKRLGNYGRVDLAMTLLKSQPHTLNLLAKANTQTINVLKHSLREAPKAEVLKAAKPELSIFEKGRRRAQPILNAAACIMIIALSKAGIFTSIENSQKSGSIAARNYYAMHVGNEMADDIFS
jgi:hypothetical protein